VREYDYVPQRQKREFEVFRYGLKADQDKENDRQYSLSEGGEGRSSSRGFSDRGSSDRGFSDRGSSDRNSSDRGFGRRSHR
jgi:hypothetical protein